MAVSKAQCQRIIKISIVIFVAGFAGLMVLAGQHYFFVGNHKQSYKHSRHSDKYESSIGRSREYLDKTYAQIPPSYQLFLDYLDRKYDLGNQFKASARNLQPPLDPTLLAEFKVYQRITYPNELVSTLPLTPTDSMSLMMMEALYCDRIPLPPNFDQLVQSNVNKGKYFLTHAAFSLQRMQENGCNYFTAEQSQYLRLTLASAMTKIVTEPTTAPDLRYETIAFLTDAGRQDLISRAWIDQIVTEQRSDGGWKPTTSKGHSSPHATMLALWALLGYTRSDMPDNPMIRRPSPL